MKIYVVALCVLASTEYVLSSQQFEGISDVVNVPESLMAVVYKNFEVNRGNELTPTQVMDIPEVTLTGSTNSNYYTLAMIDPDAPSRQNPVAKEYLHWLVGNIPGNDVSKGDVLASYVGAGPPKGTGLHRYIFLLFKQPSKINFEKVAPDSTGMGRSRFSITKFAQDYNLQQPAIAGNYFQAQYDLSVPKIHKQLSGR